MTITEFRPEELPAVCALFNAGAEGEYPHRKLTETQFSALFLEDTERVQKCSLTAWEGGQLVGFANGCVQNGKEIGYVTFVLVSPEFRRKGIGAVLLGRLEKTLAEKKALTEYQITFFNPINLTWIVPGTPMHDHPNAPGIDVSTGAYLFFKNLGYLDFAYQNSFYLPLAQYEMPEKIQERIRRLPERGLSICRFDPARHHGLAELCDDLENPLWKEELLANAARPDGGDPLMIAEHEGQAVGFVGPLRVQESGRGYFAGIGVHSQFRQYGLGKAMFATLCASLKEMGAGYMTLFTGETNPARNIYQAAGIRIVKTWADMKKEIPQ